ncbi:hypothetical protein [Glutamicibacter nicotianae]|uniref:hypothetical protein n=1 Tax=Glutamicibacter nicotianae TaxID=37929 RepID=UPI001FCA1B61|nr:hypothetical protein [Glutamicibacter nicotianae]
MLQKLRGAGCGCGREDRYDGPKEMAVANHPIQQEYCSNRATNCWQEIEEFAERIEQVGPGPPLRPRDESCLIRPLPTALLNEKYVLKTEKRNQQQQGPPPPDMVRARGG